MNKTTLATQLQNISDCIQPIYTMADNVERSVAEANVWMPVKVDIDDHLSAARRSLQDADLDVRARDLEAANASLADARRHVRNAMKVVSDAMKQILKGAN